MSHSPSSENGVGQGSTDIHDLLAFAAYLADLSGEILRPRFRAGLDVDNKDQTGGFDPVTEADRLVEEKLRAEIEKNYPAHSIVGEEHGIKKGDAPYSWILDPIDGTRSFIAGVPLWGTLIALNDGTRPIIGVVDQPYLGERFIGIKTNDVARAELQIAGSVKQMKVRTCDGLGHAILTSTDPAMFADADELAAFRAVESQARLTRYSMDCYGYCLLALGALDLVIESGLAPYDIQALIPIIDAAGGIVTDWNGNVPLNGGQIVVAGDARVHTQALEILARAAKPTL